MPLSLMVLVVEVLRGRGVHLDDTCKRLCLSLLSMANSTFIERSASSVWIDASVRASVSRELGPSLPCLPC